MRVEGETLVTVNGHKFGIGRFSTPSLKQLRSEVQALAIEVPGSKSLSVDFVVGDVSLLHADPAYRHATFQAASQFNCLEFVSPGVTPEHGITIYEHDKTQGPACR